MSKEKDELTYAACGVNYDQMDPFKRKAQIGSLATSNNIEWSEGIDIPWSVGESAHLTALPHNRVHAHIEEGLGTKCLVADAMYKLTGKSYYDHIAQDTVAMIVNDMITLGVLPLGVAMHLAVGSSDWFKDEQRAQDLIDGWTRACTLAKCVYGGGETPTLEGIINPEAVVLSGSAWGIGNSTQIMRPNWIREDDVILVLRSSGIHANGLSLARKIAKKLPREYLTQLDDGRTFGEALLAPTHIYVPFLHACHARDIKLHYAVNITGHGWRKLMRSPHPFAYIIHSIPVPQPEFRFMMMHGPIKQEEAYGNFNMGAGFAVYLDRSDVGSAMLLAKDCGFDAMIVGEIKAADERRVEIRPLDLTFRADTLQVR